MLLGEESTVGAPDAGGPPHLTVNEILSVLLLLTDAHFAPRQPMLLEELLVVLLRDPLDRKNLGRLLLALVRPERVRRRLLALEQGFRSRDRGGRLFRHVLVDRARLPAGEDVLH